MRQSTVHFAFAGLNIAMIGFPPVLHPISVLNVGFAVFLVVLGIRARREGR
jgi:hypothetical protein